MNDLQENPTAPQTSTTAVDIRNLSFNYGSTQALKDITLDVKRNEVTAFIGPSGCGKSTLLRCINRMNDEIVGTRITKGEILIDDINIYDRSVDVVKLRREVGMVFQKSNPFPSSIYDNVAYGLRMRGERNSQVLDQSVQESLEAAALWDEVKDRLKESALGLSGGQQQRLCIARTIAVKPIIVLMDEPCSALDPIATAKVEDLIWKLKHDYTFIIVTHNMQQAARVSDKTAFFYMGELVEYSDTRRMFSNPSVKKPKNTSLGVSADSNFISNHSYIMSNQHIFQEMDLSMKALKEKVQLMASLTSQNIKNAIQALLNQDIDLARIVIGEDTEVDELEVKIDQMGMDILIRFHPMASDLRAVITAMKSAHNLERISDHAVNIAKRAKKICKSKSPIEVTIIEPLFAMANQILNDALRAYNDGDSDLGEGLHVADEKLDEAYKQVSALLSGRLESPGTNAENILHLILVARSIERIGDLAVNIGEDSVFLSKARDIRHEQRKAQS